MKKKKFLIMYPVILGVACVALTLTFVLTLIKHGYGDSFFYEWLKAFVPTAFVIAPLGMASTFVLDKLVNFLFKELSHLPKKIILAIKMGLVIEFFVSLITMLTSQNFDNFFYNWMMLYLKSIPLGFCMGLFMSFVFKPWMEGRLKMVEAIEKEFAQKKVS